MHSTQHFLSNIPKTPTDIDTIKRWELYIAAQVPNIGEISHLASYLDSLALQKINSPRKDTSFRAEYSCFLRMIDLYRDDLPGDARLHNVPQSHLLLSTLSYKLFEHIFEPYLKKHTQEQNFLKVSTGKDSPGPLVASWTLNRQAEVARVLGDGGFDPLFTPEISARIKFAVLATIDKRLGDHFGSTYLTNNRELYLYNCLAIKQFRVRALLAIDHPLAEVKEVLLKHTRGDMLAEEIAKDPQLAGMKAFQIYLKFMNSFSKTPQSVGGVYIDPSVHYSPITIGEF